MNEKKIIQLTFIHHGNGLSIYASGSNDKGTIIGVITDNRDIVIFSTNPYRFNIKHMETIINTAKTDDRNISTSQKEKVFNTRPNTQKEECPRCNKQSVTVKTIGTGEGYDTLYICDNDKCKYQETYP